MQPVKPLPSPLRPPWAPMEVQTKGWLSSHLALQASSKRLYASIIRRAFCCLTLISGFLLCHQSLAAWPESIDQVFEVMVGVVGVRGIPTEEGGIIILGDYLLENYAERVQRIDRNGNLLWNPEGNGIPLSPEAGGWRYETSGCKLLSDGRNGIYILYSLDDAHNGEPGVTLDNIYLQHFNSNGEREWEGNGLTLDTLHGDFGAKRTVDLLRFLDNQLAAFWVSYDDVGPRTYGQIIDREGNKLWNENGKLVHNDQASKCVADDTNGFFLFSGDWIQYIDGNGDSVWDGDGIAKPFFTSWTTQLPDGNIMFCGCQNFRARNYFLNIIEREGRLRWEESRQLTDSPDSHRDGSIDLFYNNHVFFQVTDSRNGNEKAYGQMLDFEGSKLWGASDVDLFPVWFASYPATPIISGNYIYIKSIVFEDSAADADRIENEKIQKVDVDGNLLFGETGLELNPPFHNNYRGPLMLDGSGGLIYPAFRSRRLCLWRIRPNGTFGAGQDNSVRDGPNLNVNRSQMIVYPNPTNSQVTIQAPCLGMDIRWELFDASGRLIQGAVTALENNPIQGLKLSLEGLNAGAYLFRVRNRYSSQSQFIILTK